MPNELKPFTPAFFFSLDSALFAFRHSAMAVVAVSFRDSSPNDALRAAVSEVSAAVSSVAVSALAPAYFSSTGPFRAAASASERMKDSMGFCFQPCGLAIQVASVLANPCEVALRPAWVSFAWYQATVLKGAASASAARVALVAAIFSSIPSGGRGRKIRAPARIRARPSQIAQ